jgi:hypothetical protein
MKTKVKSLTLISRFAAMLVVLCIVPSGAFASVNDPLFTPVQNVTEENFADFQTDLLASISEQIAELQNFYTNVSEASNASELQEVLSCHIPANGYEPTGMNNRPYGMSNESCGITEFDLYRVENVTDDNYTDVQTEIVDSIGNTTEMLKAEQINLIKAGKDEGAKELGERIVKLEYLSTNMSEASSAAKLQEVMLTYMKTQAIDSIEKEIKHIETKVSNIENTTDGLTDNIIKLDDRISELTAQREKINGAKSLADLKKLIPTYREIVGIDIVCSTQNGRCEGCDCNVSSCKNTE